MEEKVSIKVNPGGPYTVKGSFILINKDRSESIKKGSFALCRCGGSNNKPFCDGTHKKRDFDKD